MNKRDSVTGRDKTVHLSRQTRDRTGHISLDMYPSVPVSRSKEIKQNDH